MKRKEVHEKKQKYHIVLYCDTIFVSVVIYNDNCSTGDGNQIKKFDDDRKSTAVIKQHEFFIRI